VSEIALTLLVLSAVAVLGLWFGSLRLRGVSLGIGGVLFSGLLLGDLAHRFDWALDTHALHFIKEFGLILFVYTIGIQVGPGFFASLKRSGLRLNALAFAVVLLGGLVTLGIHALLDVPLTALLGLYSGAVTNTPSLAAGQQILGELGADKASVADVALGYAMAYPFGVIGILVSMWGLRAVLGFDRELEIRRASRALGERADLLSINVQVLNPNLDQMPLTDFVELIGDEVKCSRIKSQGELHVAAEGSVLHLGDIVHLVGADEQQLHHAQALVGRLVEESLSTKGTQLRSERVIVTNEDMLGKHLFELNLRQLHNVVISRVNRSGVELVANRQTTLQFGDIVSIIGAAEDIQAVANLLGNASAKLQQVHVAPMFLGIALGVLLGSIPFYLPSLPAPVRLGLAGGPLLVALLLSRIGSIGRLHWFMPPSANQGLREIGIVLFLGVVGLSAGAGFVSTLVEGDGLRWMACGVAVTLIPLLGVGLLARAVLKMDHLSVCGVLAGSMTDPPALAFANDIVPGNGAPALAYATVYPLAMCLRILSPQLIAILLFSAS